jgi:prevent-host-death family protein
MASWAVQDAKARFSELLETAQKNGPQTITRRGVETAVVVPIEEWRRRFPASRVETPVEPMSTDEFLRFLRSAPDFEIPDRHALRHKRAAKR